MSALAAPTQYVSQAKWAKPLPKRNMIPQQNFLKYNWINKDPDLEFVIAAIGNSGKSAEWIEEQTESYGHRVSRYTILNWCYGDVKRPQNASMNMVMSVLGYTRQWTEE